MTEVKGGAISVTLFLAHSLELEIEARDRYVELGSVLSAHNNADVSTLFETLGRYAQMHVTEVERLAEEVGGIPTLAAWEFVWPDNEAPETAGHDEVHYLMSPHKALEVAHANEVGARDYYKWIAETTQDADVRRLARSFEEEESRHAQLLALWLDKFPNVPENWDQDLDPPQCVD
ncbi:Rubrerythrin [uncultured Gammaproteobacteria bacterium]